MRLKNERSYFILISPVVKKLFPVALRSDLIKLYLRAQETGAGTHHGPEKLIACPGFKFGEKLCGRRALPVYEDQI